MWIRVHDCIAVFIVLLNAAELEINAPLQLLRQRREGPPVLKALGQLTAQIAVAQRLAGGDEIGLYRLVVAPEYLTQRPAL